MFVTTNKGKIEYFAAPPQFLKAEMRQWSDDLALFSVKGMKMEAAIFYTSLLNFTFMKIHPLEDGTAGLVG